jgi:phage tail sheath gpL-like
MPTAPVIVGFATNNRVPGVYGETIYGAGAISAASVPLLLLLVGTKLSTGSATPNQDVVQILSTDDADASQGPGGELARMCYNALKVPGVQIKAAPVAEAAGAVAATQVITLSGTWATAGQLSYRVNGELISSVVQASDSIATACTNLASIFNQDFRRPYTASASATQVTLTFKSKGARANQYVIFQDTSLVPSGLVSTIAGAVWTGAAVKTTISYAVPTVSNGYYYKASVGGTTAASEPSWPTTIGATVVDGTVTWTAWGKVLTGNATTPGGGTGTESVTTLLGVLTPQGYDRIVTAENDAGNAALWTAQLNAQAGPTSNLLQHAIMAVNGTLAAATTLATTSLNAQRVQLLWYQNSETAPWETSAYFGALRTATEQSDPAASYDDVVIVGTAPQSQPADRPTNAVLQSAVNNGVSPLYTSPNGNQAQMCISITSHSLSGSTPDYRTFNTSDAYVPDFVRRDIGLYWSTVFKPNNPRVADDPAADAKPALSGVATPGTWNPAIVQKLRNYANGILASGSAPTTPTVAPIIILVDFNLPTTVYDPIAKRLVSVIPVVPAPPNHQLGVSVRQVTSS